MHFVSFWKSKLLDCAVRKALEVQRFDGSMNIFIDKNERTDKMRTEIKTNIEFICTSFGDEHPFTLSASAIIPPER